MMNKYPECNCEDYPCCGHYDIVHGDEGMPEYCDRCGGNHSPFYDCDEDYDDEEYEDDLDLDDDTDDHDYDEDAASIRGVLNRVRVNAFGQRIRLDAPELPGDHWLDNDDREEY